jgi:glycerol-3-phosphate O-acyltransferase/dihydroxyacetone phosphate acyltransferase
LGLYRDLHDTRPGGVGIYFISHVGGHKYAANVMIYRRGGFEDQKDGETKNAEQQQNGFLEVNGTVEANEVSSELEKLSLNGEEQSEHDNGVVTNGETARETEAQADTARSDWKDDGATQGIWLARVRPEDCENIVKFTVLQGKVVKPQRQLRGGFDRGRGVVSW